MAERKPKWLLCPATMMARGGLDKQTAIFWAFVGIPPAWGIWITLKNAMRIFWTGGRAPVWRVSLPAQPPGYAGTILA